MSYQKKKWIDHIKDQNGNVIQQGTPLSGGNMNHIESGIANTTIVADNNLAVIKEAIPSGFIKMNGIDYDYMATNPNKIKLKGDGVAFVNGYEINILDGTIINLSEPPTSGKREDLVFLEVWKEPATDTEGEKVNYRIRVVDDIDFYTYVEGIDEANIRGMLTNNSAAKFAKSNTDVGLYSGSVVGSNNDTDIYAIPMLRVYRRNSSPYSVSNGNGAAIKSAGESSRIDLLYADIIVERDIIDLRHKVSLTGFNYQQLLLENTDKFFREELQVEKKRLLKTYHGIRKTPVDANTVFYASLDGTTIAEVGGAPTEKTDRYKPSPTGLGLCGNCKYTNLNINSSILTIDCILDFNQVSYKSYQGFFSFLGINFRLESAVNEGIVQLIFDSINGKMDSFSFNVFEYPPISHIRIIKNKNILQLYINGKLYRSVDNCKENLGILNELAINCQNYIGYNISDFSISNIDRGDTFATLPQDVIDCYAQIAPAFNNQRRILSDALTSQYTVETVKAAGGNSKQLSIMQATARTWTAGDTIKVKGLGGELIGGVIDSDTIFAYVTQDSNGDTKEIHVNNTIGFKVGEEIRFIKENMTYDGSCKVVSVDEANKIITFDVTKPVSKGDMLGSISSTSSAPVIKYGNTAVVGTWSNLNTNEATFTLGANSGLTNQDLQIEYSLNIPVGQGGMPEVLTEVLGGEMGGKKMIVNPSYHIEDDFKDKVPGSVVECPHIAKEGSQATLATPNAFTKEFIDYVSIDSLNGIVKETSTTVKDEIPQQLYSFNVIEEVKRKYGITWTVEEAKQKTAQIVCNWYGNGSCPSGNKAHIGIYNGSSYTDNLSDATTPKLTSIKITDTLPLYIDKNGFMNCVVHADPSDGTTPSIVRTDYINIEITLKTIGYDVLTLENRRAREEKGNILLIKKENKEIQTMFRGLNNLSGVVTYGNYVPVPKQLDANKEVTVLAEIPNYLVTDLSTSSGDKQEGHHWKNILSKINNNITTLSGNFGYGRTQFSEDTAGANIGRKVTIGSTGFVNNYTKQYGLSVTNNPLVAIARYLVMDNGELKLLIVSKYVSSGTINMDNGAAILVPITNRPLVKAAEGTISPSITPKVWDSSEEELMGYVNLADVANVSSLKGIDSGTGTFGSYTGVTIDHNLGTSNFDVVISPSSIADTGTIGEYSVPTTSKTSTSFKVYNTGSNNTDTFDWIARAK